MKEIKSLTGLRGIAALYIALYHNLEVKGYTGNSIWQIFINHGHLAVDIFFLLSGFVMAYSSGKLFTIGIPRKNYLLFMHRRFARIYPLYILVLTFAFIFINHFDGKINYLIGLTLLTIISGKSYVMIHLWSISTEWVAYLLFPILYKTGKFKEGINWNIFLIAACFILLILWYKYPKLLFLPPPSGSTEFTAPMYPTLLKCFIEYILGIVAFNLYKGLEISDLKVRFLLFLNTTLIIFMLFNRETDIYFIALGFSFIFFLSKEVGFINKALKSKVIYFLGTISYSLYLLHPIFLTFFKSKFKLSYSIPVINNYLFNFAYISTVILVSYLTYIFIEVPMKNLLTKNTKQTIKVSRI